MKRSHYWVFETPNGSNTTGICKYCGEKQSSSNTLIRKKFIKREKQVGSKEGGVSSQTSSDSVG